MRGRHMMLAVAALLSLLAAVRWAPDVLAYATARVTFSGSGQGGTAGAALIDCSTGPRDLTISKGKTATISVTCSNRLGAAAPGTASMSASVSANGGKSPPTLSMSPFAVAGLGATGTITVSTSNSTTIQPYNYTLTITVTTGPLTYSKTYPVATITVTK